MWFDVAELRLAVRSSLTKKEKEQHIHDFGQETYDEEEDTYSKTCKTCSHTVTYEKMWQLPQRPEQIISLKISPSQMG